MNTTKIGAELVVEATASLKQEVEKELKVPDPVLRGAAGIGQLNDLRTWQGENGKGNTP